MRREPCAGAYGSRRNATACRSTPTLNLMNSRPLLIDSQRWKLLAGLAGAVVLALPLFIPGRLTGLVAEIPYVLAAAALAGICALLTAALGVRCPSCGLNLVAWGISRNSAGTWLSWLLAAQACPRCGYRSDREGESA